MPLKVELINHTPNPEHAIAVAARLCYAPVGASDLLDSMDEASQKSVLRTILNSGHLSALEHACFSFAVEGISRALTHQLVRHRLASYNQQSQRYVSYKNGIEKITPSSISEVPEAAKIFNDVFVKIDEAYKQLLEMNIPAEDARYILPNAAETKIVITMNVRELLHFFRLRCCNRAQWEIRAMAHEMLRLCQPHAPYIFACAGAPCVEGKCPEGRMSCGHPYQIMKRD